MKLFTAGALALARKVPLPIRIALRRLQWFTSWVFPRLWGLVAPRPGSRRRVLVVYDTTTQPFSVGDILYSQMAALVLCERYGVETTDFAILYDPQEPTGNNRTFAAAVTRENVTYHIASLLPMAQVNQRLGSFFVFNSKDQITRWMADSADEYHVWPSGLQVGARSNLSSFVMNELLVQHHRQHGRIPHLSCRPFLRQWAKEFYREQVEAGVAVTVNLRNNPGWHKHRNSRMESWLSLFQYCESRYPVRFFILCSRAEIDESLRQCGNVTFVKDHHTTVEQDMALINMSAMHMGGDSGPVAMAVFGAAPYLWVDTGKITETDFYQHDHMIERIDSGARRLWFAGPSQRIILGPEDAETLIREFEVLFRYLNVEEWRRNIDETIGSERAAASTWLR
jgi:hypothetical protein